MNGTTKRGSKNGERQLQAAAKSNQTTLTFEPIPNKQKINGILLSQENQKKHLWLFSEPKDIDIDVDVNTYNKENINANRGTSTTAKSNTYAKKTQTQSVLPPLHTQSTYSQSTLDNYFSTQSK